MSPPINIDGSEIQRATIDGEDVSEITIDGQQTAGFGVIPDSALAQDLIAWWRFEDGDARDYTNDLDATFADSTAYDGTVNGATYLSSGGVTDFESGANSGAFEFGGDAAGDFIDIPDLDAISTPLTICGWFKINNQKQEHAIALNIFEADQLYPLVFDDPPVFRTIFSPGPILTSASLNLNEWYFHASTIDSNGAEIYLGRNGTFTLEDSGGGASATYNGAYKIGARSDLNPTKYANADIEDNRLYDRVLSQSELQSIYDDTKPQ